MTDTRICTARLDLALDNPKAGVSRRLALKVVATAPAAPLAVASFRQFGAQPRFHTWIGIVLGRDASLSLWHSEENWTARRES